MKKALNKYNDFINKYISALVVTCFLIISVSFSVAMSRMPEELKGGVYTSLIQTNIILADIRSRVKDIEKDTGLLLQMEEQNVRGY